MLQTLDTMNEPCANLARRLREERVAPEVAHDALEVLVEEYARHVEGLLHPKATPAGIEFAYSRLLGARGNICRLCPVSEMPALPRRCVRRWEWAETRLRDHFTDPLRMEELAASRSTWRTAGRPASSAMCRRWRRGWARRRSRTSWAS